MITNEETKSVPAIMEADFAMICKGDGMINARIFDGDLVYIRQQETVGHGEIAAVLIDGVPTLGRMRCYADCTLLEFANPMYQTHELSEDTPILGKAIAFASAL